MRLNVELSSPITSFGFDLIGSIRSKGARDIDSFPGSIGFETMDRGYVDHAKVGPYSGQLGAKDLRILAEGLRRKWRP